MYADRVAAGRKRSVKERLNGNLDESFARPRQTIGKRQRPDDDKWKHDLYDDHEEFRAPNPKIGGKDLRLKLQKKVSQQMQSGSGSRGICDLREKLSSTLQAPTTTADPASTKTFSEAAKPVKTATPSAEASGAGFKKAVDAASTNKKNQKKEDKNTVEGLLKSLGLVKYLITFQAEEIDMTALMHMNDEDLKALGIPMGPRKKILLALDSRV